MNPRLLLLVLASMAILSSCTKETFTPTSDEPIPGSVIEIFYDEEASTIQESNSRFLYVAPPPSISQDCKNATPSFIVPKMHNNTLEFIYAKNSKFTGISAEKIKALKWTVNGETQLITSTTLELPYQINDVFNIELVVTFTDDSTHEANFNFEASPNLQTLNDGTITYNTGANSFDGVTISQSCADHLNRAISIVIIETNF